MLMPLVSSHGRHRTNNLISRRTMPVADDCQRHWHRSLQLQSDSDAVGSLTTPDISKFKKILISIINRLYEETFIFFYYICILQYCNRICHFYHFVYSFIFMIVILQDSMCGKKAL